MRVPALLRRSGPAFQNRGDTMPRTVAGIIGDNFASRIFGAEADRGLPGPTWTSAPADAWPDEPMEHGYASPAWTGSGEYFGTADDVVEFVGDAEIFTPSLPHVARHVRAAARTLKLIAVVSRGPSQYRHAGGARSWRAGRQRPAAIPLPWPVNSRWAPSGQDPQIRGHRRARRRLARRSLPRRRDGARTQRMTVGVIGYSNIGTRVVRLLRLPGKGSWSTIPMSSFPRGYQRRRRIASFDRCWPKSDIVTLRPRDRGNPRPDEPARPSPA